MLINGEWLVCGDGIVRPVIRGEVLATNGLWVPVPFFLDTGADRTVFSAAPAKPPRKRSRDPKPLAGLIHQPWCPVCEHQGQSPTPLPPGAPPPIVVHTQGCPRQRDPSAQCCPNPDCAYHGRVGCGNLQANGHPSGRLWRQGHCVQCGASFVEPHGTPFHGKPVSPDLLVWAVGTLAEGLGIRACTARSGQWPRLSQALVTAAGGHGRRPD